MKFGAAVVVVTRGLVVTFNVPLVALSAIPPTTLKNKTINGNLTFIAAPILFLQSLATLRSKDLELFCTSTANYFVKLNTCCEEFYLLV